MEEKVLGSISMKFMMKKWSRGIQKLWATEKMHRQIKKGCSLKDYTSFYQMEALWGFFTMHNHSPFLNVQ